MTPPQLLLGLVLASALQSTDPALREQEEASTRAYWRTKSALDAQAAERHERITTELALIGEGDEHPWAGVYRTRGRSPLDLRLAPDAGYTLLQQSYCANCGGWLGVGKVLGSDGGDLALEVELGFELSPRSDPYRFPGMQSTLHLVRWGDLLFAVTPRRMELFCAEYSDGFSFPDVPFRELVVDPELVGRPGGAPQVPERYSHLLLTSPKSCRLVALEQWVKREPRLFPTDEVHDAVFAIDAGSDDGLAVGMRFWIDGEDTLGVWGRVEEVGPERGRIRFAYARGGRERAEAMVDRRATTRHPRCATPPREAASPEAASRKVRPNDDR